MRRLFLFITLAFFFYISGRAQDSAYYVNHPDELRALLSTVEKKQRSSTLQPEINAKNRPRKFNNQVLTPFMYRPTRLGSSSPQYNTYIQNHYGAGGVTTNPHKWGSSAPAYQQSNAYSQLPNAGKRPPKYNSQKLTPKMYRPTRLGSSSPKYDTYIENSYGAGSVTTSPKHGGSPPPVIVKPQNKVPSPPASENAKDDSTDQKK